MVVKVSLQKLNQLVDVHRLLYKRELPLQASVLRRLLKREHPVLLQHPEHDRIYAWPVLGVRLAQN